MTFTGHVILALTRVGTLADRDVGTLPAILARGTIYDARFLQEIAFAGYNLGALDILAGRHAASLGLLQNVAEISTNSPKLRCPSASSCVSGLATSRIADRRLPRIVIPSPADAADARPDASFRHTDPWS